jgi:hypothetical protein
MKTLKLTITLIGILNFFGCDDSKLNCGEVPFSTLDFSNVPNLQIVNNDVEDLYLVINSKEEFEEKIFLNDGEGREQFEIDYRRNTLLIGKVKLTGIEGTMVEQSVENTCKSKSYTYNLVVKNGGFTALGNFYFGVVIPKKEEKEIIFNIKRI